MKKVYIIKGKDEEELAKNINEFDKDIFATQPLQKKNGEFIAFVYVNEGNTPTPRSSNEYNPNKPTVKQIYRLEQMGISKEEIDKMSKMEATTIIGESMKKETY